MIDQVGILFFGLMGPWMLAWGHYRAGFALSLCAQPFWIWSTWQAGQFGAFIVSIIFTIVWGVGLLRHWRKE